jgi:hypothetical protein
MRSSLIDRILESVVDTAATRSYSGVENRNELDHM